MKEHSVSAGGPVCVCVVRMGFSALVSACVVVLCSAAPFNLLQRNEPQNDRPIIGKPLTLILYVEQMCAPKLLMQNSIYFKF